jgi:Holliday junction DNA helicase RuvA
MISRLTGRLSHKVPDHCIIDVGGVGYHVCTSVTTFGMLPELDSTLSLDIHTYVREDQLQLFGFATREEKAMFVRLISISGVGPKTALAILSGLPTADLMRAIGGGDAAMLSTIPGVGKKTSERICVELRDKIAKEFEFTSKSPTAIKPSMIEDAQSALINLGYKRQAAEAALQKIKCDDGMKIEDMIRSALRELNRI